jgi:hypothetical protein
MIRGARFVRRRRLLRAAAVGGVAYQAGKHIDQERDDEAGRQARLDEMDAPVAARQAPETPPPAPSPSPDMPAKLKMLDELGGLHERGVLSDEEFAQQKQRVLEG